MGKALMIVGHIPSEQGGMRECARWLQSVLPPLRIEFIPSSEPFWLPSFEV